MIHPRPIAITDALRHAQAQRVLAVAPHISAQDIATHIPAEIRQRSFFSARTPYAQYLADVHSDITRTLQPNVRIGPDGLVPTVTGDAISPAQIRARMKQRLDALGYQPDPEKRGTLQDLSSDRRTNLIIETQTAIARGYGDWRSQQNPDILDVYPASELYRAMPRDKRRDWDDTWNSARSDLGNATTATYALDRDYGPFIATKNDPIWSAISRFGNPYPPFDYGSGMRTRDVSRRRAIDAGVVAPGQPAATPAADPLNQPYSLDLASIPADIAAALDQAFAGAGRLEDGTLHILPDPAQTLAAIIHHAAAGQQATGAIALASPSQRAAINAITGTPIPAGSSIDITTDAIRNSDAATDLLSDLPLKIAAATPLPPPPQAAAQILFRADDRSILASIAPAAGNSLARQIIIQAIL